MGKIRPLPSDLSLSGKTACITGATAGLGLETARQFLELGIATLILAVRDVDKGQATREMLLSQTRTRSHSVDVKVLKLDLDDYASISSFSKALEVEAPVLDILILNAGGMFHTYSTSTYNHEKTVQVNFLSNAYLLLSLLPYLETTSLARSGQPARVTWIGSRSSYKTAVPEDPSSALAAFDSASRYDFQRSYASSKYLVASFFHMLATKIPKEKVVLSLLCPGPVKTDLARDLPFYYKPLVAAWQAFATVGVEKGAWTYVYASAVLGAEEGHGAMIGEMDIEPKQTNIESVEGQRFQTKLWRETLEELRPYGIVPKELLV